MLEEVGSGHVIIQYPVYFLLLGVFELFKGNCMWKCLLCIIILLVTSLFQPTGCVGSCQQLDKHGDCLRAETSSYS